MPYSQTTLDQFVGQIGDLMDDPGHVYWKVPEITFALWEALRVWGALTNYWRTRGSFALVPSPSPYYDLSIQLPNLRTRSWTLGQMVQEIQYMLLENPSGISGAGMSGQITIQSILNAIQAARNRFVLDVHLPLSIHSTPSGPPPPQGMVQFDQSSVFVHRASWLDAHSLTWNNVWREDIWSADKNDPTWTLEPTTPQIYSEAENSPLKLQLSPAPNTEGSLEILSVDSSLLDLTNPAATFGIPDEWIHAVKYSALSYILYGEGQIKDVVRAEYAERRYQQAVEFAKDARSVFRLLSNNVPLPLDSLASIDAGSPFWRNQVGPPEMAGALYDIVTFSPGSPDQPYGITADVSQTAPLPTTHQFIQLGYEDIDHIIDYVSHVLTFKCGGDDFKSTYPGYDSYMSAVASRKGVNAAKIKYLTPLMGQPQVEWAMRPDRVKV